MKIRLSIAVGIAFVTLVFMNAVTFAAPSNTAPATECTGARIFFASKASPPRYRTVGSDRYGYWYSTADGPGGLDYYRKCDGSRPDVVLVPQRSSATSPAPLAAPAPQTEPVTAPTVRPNSTVRPVNSTVPTVQPQAAPTAPRNHTPVPDGSTVRGSGTTARGSTGSGSRDPGIPPVIIPVPAYGGGASPGSDKALENYAP